MNGVGDPAPALGEPEILELVRGGFLEKGTSKCESQLGSERKARGSLGRAPAGWRNSKGAP